MPRGIKYYWLWRHSHTLPGARAILTDIQPQVPLQLRAAAEAKPLIIGDRRGYIILAVTITPNQVNCCGTSSINARGGIGTAVSTAACIRDKVK